MSRTAPALTRILALPLFLAPAPLCAQAVLPIDPDVLGPIARRQALENSGPVRASPDCEQPDGDEIVICAAGTGPVFRVPYEPEPGALPRRAMGELPRPGDLGGECHRLCPSSVGISVNVGRLISDPGGALRDMFRGR